jgi:hypothetical protein
MGVLVNEYLKLLNVSLMEVKFLGSTGSRPISLTCFGHGCCGDRKMNFDFLITISGHCMQRGTVCSGTVYWHRFYYSAYALGGQANWLDIGPDRRRCVTDVSCGK